MEANVKVVVKVRPPLETPRDQVCWKVSSNSREINQLKPRFSKEEGQLGMSQRALENFSFGKTE